MIAPFDKNAYDRKRFEDFWKRLDLPDSRRVDEKRQLAWVRELDKLYRDSSKSRSLRSVYRTYFQPPDLQMLKEEKRKRIKEQGNPRIAAPVRMVPLQTLKPEINEYPKQADDKFTDFLITTSKVLEGGASGDENLKAVGRDLVKLLMDTLELLGYDRMAWSKGGVAQAATDLARVGGWFVRTVLEALLMSESSFFRVKLEQARSDAPLALLYWTLKSREAAGSQARVVV